MITIRNERSTDIPARERLLDVAFGPARLAKTSQRLREDRFAGRRAVVLGGRERPRWSAPCGLWNIALGTDRPALLLGPVAVACDAQGRGIGAKLIRRVLREARRQGHSAIVLIGDVSYYGRFGFSTDKTGALRLPGPFELHRLLGLELKRGALDGARGLIRASGPQSAGGLAGVPHWLPLDPIFSTSRLNNTFAE